MKLLASILLLSSLAAAARAQLLVSVSLERNNFITDEQIFATVTVENRAGKDIVLGGPNQMGWLQMDVREASDGKALPSTGATLKVEPLVLKNLERVTKQVNLTNYFPVDLPGMYQVGASAYFADRGLQTWIGSGRRPLFIVNSPRASIWERRGVGLPRNHPQYGRYRRYKLFSNKCNFNMPTGGGMEMQLLYVRIVDEETDGNVSTRPLGVVLRYRDPQPTVDHNGHLHVLFMSAPQIFTHVTVDLDGAIVDETRYRSGKDVPRLMETRDGYVSVRGGSVYDPVAEAQVQRERDKEVHSLSDRPASMPKPKQRE